MTKAKVTLAVLGVVGLLLLGGIGAAWEPVNEGHAKVVKDKGAATDEILEPGWHVINPATESTVSVDTRPQVYTMSGKKGEGDKKKSDSVEVLTHDGVEVQIDVSIRYRVNMTQADVFYSEYRSLGQAEARLIRPTVRSRLRTEAGDIGTSQIYTGEGQRQLGQSVDEVLREEFDGSGLILLDVQIRRVHLPKQYADSVEQKEMMKQEVQKKEYEIDKAQKEAERKIIEAEADAEANRIRDESLTDAILADKYIEALDKTDTVYVPVDGETGLPKHIDVTKHSESSDDEDSDT